MRGTAHALLGAADRATDDLRATVATGLATGSVDDVFVAEAQLRPPRGRAGGLGRGGRRARAAQALVDETNLGDYPMSAIVHAATARVALHEARPDDARAALTALTGCGHCSTTAFPG